MIVMLASCNWEQKVWQNVTTHSAIKDQLQLIATSLWSVITYYEIRQPAIILTTNVGNHNWKKDWILKHDVDLQLSYLILFICSQKKTAPQQHHPMSLKLKASFIMPLIYYSYGLGTRIRGAQGWQ